MPALSVSCLYVRLIRAGTRPAPTMRALINGRGGIKGLAGVDDGALGFQDGFKGGQEQDHVPASGCVAHDADPPHFSGQIA